MMSIYGSKKKNLFRKRRFFIRTTFKYKFFNYFLRRYVGECSRDLSDSFYVINKLLDSRHDDNSTRLLKKQFYFLELKTSQLNSIYSFLRHSYYTHHP